MIWECAKCDIHRHMGGSISPDTVWEIGKRTSGLGPTYPEIVKLMTVGDAQNIGFPAFLDKFRILDDIPWPNWAINLAVKQVCRDLSKEDIDYCEISLSLNKYVQSYDEPTADAHYQVADFLYGSFKKYCEIYGVEIGLLLSLRYDSSRDSQLVYSNIIDSERHREMFCGIDLVGDEEFFDADFYKPIFDKWRKHGKVLRAHVGEMPGTADNVRIAIEDLGVTRIAHGIQADEDTLKLAVDRGIYFDLALHSNLTTGAVSDIMEHPLRGMMGSGCLVTLNTDDPVQFGCRLDDEYRLAVNSGLITTEQAESIMHNACEAARNH